MWKFPSISTGREFGKMDCVSALSLDSIADLAYELFFMIFSLKNLLFY
jgi:hypothetical protein